MLNQLWYRQGDINPNLNLQIMGLELEKVDKYNSQVFLNKETQPVSFMLGMYMVKHWVIVSFGYCCLELTGSFGVMVCTVFVEEKTTTSD